MTTNEKARRGSLLRDGPNTKETTMSSVHYNGSSVNGTVNHRTYPYRPELSLLRVVLTAQGYHASAANEIVIYAAAEGTTFGAPGLDPVDEELCEYALETGPEPVVRASHAWGSGMGDESMWRPEDDRWTLGPEAYQPTEEDLAELHEWSSGGMGFPRQATRDEMLRFAAENQRFFEGSDDV